jgi:hypothetical protein
MFLLIADFFNFFIAKVEIFYFLFLAEYKFSTLINYSPNMC